MHSTMLWKGSILSFEVDREDVYLNEAVVEEETKQCSRRGGIPRVELLHYLRDSGLCLRATLVIESHEYVLRLQHLHLQHQCGYD